MPMLRLSCLIAAVALPASGAVAGVVQPVPVREEAIAIGRSFTFHSAVMGEDRVINIWLPDGYGTGNRAYPVIYLIDGGVDQDFHHITGTARLGATWGRSGDAIVVGIATKDRRRELTGRTADPELLARYPSAGGSAAFRRFITEDVMPFVRRSYRTNGRSGVIGESLAGLFILETFLRAPGTFDAYAAISPSLWWDKERLSQEAAHLMSPAQADRRLLIAVANEGPDMQPAVDRIRAALGPVRELCYLPRPDLTHATIYHSVSPQALQFLAPPAAPPDPQMGFTLPCSPRS